MQHYSSGNPSTMVEPRTDGSELQKLAISVSVKVGTLLVKKSDHSLHQRLQDFTVTAM